MTQWTVAHLNEVEMLGKAGNELLTRSTTDPGFYPSDFAEQVANWVASGDVLLSRVDPHWQEGGRSVGALWTKARSELNLHTHEYWDETQDAKLRIHMQQLVGIILSAANYGPPLQSPPPPDGVGVPRCHFHRRQVLPNQEMVFVAMPFAPAKEFDFVIMAIKRICEKAFGDNVLKCVRADDLTGHDVMQDVYESIASCGAVVVDTSGRNANVFIELGIAITLGKPLILITQDSLESIPFDLRRFRHFRYSVDATGIMRLAVDVARALADIHKLDPVGDLSPEAVEARIGKLGGSEPGVRVARMPPSDHRVGAIHRN